MVYNRGLRACRAVRVLLQQRSAEFNQISRGRHMSRGPRRPPAARVRNAHPPSFPPVPGRRTVNVSFRVVRRSPTCPSSSTTGFY